MADIQKGIISGQRVSKVKVEQAHAFRHQMTHAEQLLWEQLRGGRLNGLKFRRQQIIDGFIVDFYCHTAGLVVEVDGTVHETQRAYDEQRDHVLKARGLRVLRLTNDQIEHDLARVFERIAEHCT